MKVICNRTRFSGSPYQLLHSTSNWLKKRAYNIFLSTCNMDLVAITHGMGSNFNSKNMPAIGDHHSMSKGFQINQIWKTCI